MAAAGLKALVSITATAWSAALKRCHSMLSAESSYPAQRYTVCIIAGDLCLKKLMQVAEHCRIKITAGSETVAMATIDHSQEPLPVEERNNAADRAQDIASWNAGGSRSRRYAKRSSTPGLRQ